MTTRIVGILNVTPDSFSDGGHYATHDAALAHARTLIEEGADVIDVGAESTRPGATALDAAQEWDRLGQLLPSLIALCHEHGVAVSLDTYHAHTAQAAIKLGIDWINDVGGARNDDLLRAVAASANVRYVLMHSLSVPAQRDHTLHDDEDPVRAINHFFHQKSAQLHALGIPPERILYDPGIGFGKTAAQSLELLWRVDTLCPPASQLFMGHSRKSCFAAVAPTPQHRDSATLLASHYLMTRHVGYIRVHDVREHATLAKTLPARAP